MNNIKVKKSTMVRPAEETPKDILWLSKIDMIICKPKSHINVLFLYSPVQSCSKFFDTNILEEALSKVLVPFYPMAGRLKFNDENKRYEIDCNAKGALLIEAESTKALSDYGENGDYLRPDSQLRKVAFPTCDYTRGLSSFPLLLVQLTRFSCGSVCLGLSQHHHVADGASWLHFINSWARLAKGLDLRLHPVHDRATYLAPRNPTQVRFRHLEYEPPLPLSPSKASGLSGEKEPIIETIFKLTKDQISTLKLQASSQVLDYKLSTFEVQAGHVWRTACLARGLTDDQPVFLYIPVDGRSRLKDVELPQGYCGNIVFFATCLEKAKDVTSKPLWYVASKIHEAIKKINDVEYLRSAIDYVESHPDMTAISRRPENFISPNFTINSWTRLPCYEADFGWGEPMFTGINRASKSEGPAYITPSPNGDESFLVAVTLLNSHMTLFKEYFYNF